MSPTVRIAIERAQQDIKRILRDLEIETGEIVERVRITSQDTTCVSDEKEQVIRYVYIDTMRVPGMRWAE